MTSQYSDMIKALITNPSYSQDDIINILNSYKEAKIITDKEYDYLQLEIQNYYSLDNLKDKCILETRLNLSKFLEENPLFSYVKHKEGRFYRVTQEKQQHLASTLLMYQGYMANGYEYSLSWNDTGNTCEPWAYEELFLLATEINNYVTPLVALQQATEISIKNAKTKEEVLSINTNPYQ